MKFDKNTKILIVGLGLIGGSYAKALSDEGYFVGAIDKKKSSVEYALKNGLIRVGETSVKKDFVKDFDLIVFALYPHDFINWIKEYQSSIKSGALITDVTGVKSFVVENVQKILRDDLEFVGAHPMAGKEVSGVENADPEIFVGANYIVTPTKKNTDENVQAVKDLGRALGFERISSLSPEEHDETVGFFVASDALHRRIADGIQKVAPSCRIYGRFLPRPYPHRKNQRRNVERTFPCKQG